jgi:AcrR family transcriptional regulator
MVATRNKITRAALAFAALEIVDTAGAEALTARSLAAAVGCKPMSLYHHVGSMDDVRDMVVDCLLAPLQPASGALVGRAAIGRHALRYLALAEEHPRAFSLVATRRWRTPSAIAFGASLVQSFAASGLASAEAVGRARVLGAYLNGAGLGLSAWLISPIDVTEMHGNHGPFEGRRSSQAVKADLVVGLDQLLRILVPGDTGADGGR